ncbi:60S ribosomal protein L22-like [Brachypodium distachyon]|uniref:60S ribosomal protein L22-like n=1 Tax=Brachypodium distachyon TaxID=15368 RepID=UPI0005300259|nr:60S ribosomal protein L22-like [Brachypodium distachyon]|eukprot:XP_010233289.1 60S ribosomal protein L22-like [Brachypodium distachyon]
MAQRQDAPLLAAARAARPRRSPLSAHCRSRCSCCSPALPFALLPVAARAAAHPGRDVLLPVAVLPARAATRCSPSRCGSPGPRRAALRAAARPGRDGLLPVAPLHARAATRCSPSRCCSPGPRRPALRAAPRRAAARAARRAPLQAMRLSTAMGMASPPPREREPSAFSFYIGWHNNGRWLLLLLDPEQREEEERVASTLERLTGQQWVTTVRNMFIC